MPLYMDIHKDLDGLTAEAVELKARLEEAAPAGVQLHLL